MKRGVGKGDTRSVDYLIGEGLKVEEISKRLNIAVEGLIEYEPKLKVTPKKKTAPKKKKVVKKDDKPDTDLQSGTE